MNSLKIHKGLIALVVAVILVAGLSIALRSTTYFVERPQKNVIVFYSETYDDTGFGKLRERLAEYLSDGEFDVRIFEYYVKMDGHSHQMMLPIDEALAQTPNPDIILCNGDHALSNLLLSKRREISSVPVIFSGVNFPDMEMIRKRSNFSGVTDIPDFRTNLQMIKQILPNVVVEMNFSNSVLGRRRHAELMRQIKNYPVSITYEYISDETYVDSTYRRANTRNRISVNPNSIPINFVPMSSMSGRGLINHFVSTKSKSQYAFLMSKYEGVTSTVCKLYNQPVFSAIHKGFGNEIGVVGGYFTSEDDIAHEWADIAKEFLANPKHKRILGESKKSYHFDYNILQLWSMSTDNLPKGADIVGMPWTIRFSSLILMLVVLLIVIVVTILYTLYIIKLNAIAQTRETRELQRDIDALLMSINQTNISMFRIAPDGSCYIAGRDLNGNVKYTLDDLRDFIHPADYDLVFDKIRSTKLGARGSFQLRVRTRFNHNYQWYQARYGVVEGPGGIIISGLVEDISHAKEHEEELIKSRDMAELAESKQSFLDNLSHEIRTPLNAIVGFSSVLCSEEAQYLSEEERQEMVSLINHNNDVLMSLIVDILELSRIESGYIKFKFAKTRLNDILAAAYESEKEHIKPQIDFRLELSNENPQITTVSMRLQQVLHYIVGNANKFTNSGEIVISTRVLTEKNLVVINVADTGCGIEYEQIKLVFDRFYKTDIFVQGTGLGLSICDVIIRNLGGKIGVYSKVGIGSTFSIILPIHPVIHKDAE